VSAMTMALMATQMRARSGDSIGDWSEQVQFVLAMQGDGPSDGHA
jgi:hypothetical protein